MTRRGRLIAGLVLAGGLCAPAVAADTKPDVLRMPATDLITFERWCLDEAKLDEARCTQRRPDDEAEFVVFRNTIERYEAQFIYQRHADRVLKYERLETQDTLVPPQY
ncbi:MAG: hypothetical protein GC199_11290 [Alphaproteobacteria bacterium]|nr:hypothetical protein [Alphaproteobacteria bacterium]